jgi:hypothetical protein
MKRYPSEQEQRMFCMVYLSEYLESPVALDDAFIIEPLMDAIRVFSMVSNLNWGMWSIMRAPQAPTFDEFSFLGHAKFRFDFYFRTKKLYQRRRGEDGSSKESKLEKLPGEEGSNVDPDDAAEPQPSKKTAPGGLAKTDYGNRGRREQEFRTASDLARDRQMRNERRRRSDEKQGREEEGDSSSEATRIQQWNPNTDMMKILLLCWVAGFLGNLMSLWFR